MSNCFSLISCDGTCPSKHNISGTAIALLTPFLDTLVQVNGNTSCTYYVRDEKMVGFRIQDPKELCTKASNTSRTSQSYSITSLVYNTRQYVYNPITYTIGIGRSYQCLTCEPINGAFCTTAVGNTYNNSNAHTDQINLILQTLGLDIQMFPFGISGSSVFRLYNSDTLQFRLERTGLNVPIQVWELLFDGTNLTVTYNGTNVTSNLVNETTNTCTSSKSNVVNSVSGVSACTLVNNYIDYTPLTDCDPIILFPMGAFCLVTNTLGTVGATRTGTLVVTGGTPPYTYEWDNGNRTNTISNLPAGTYGATVRDYFGDFEIRTSCTLPSIVCSAITITTTITYTCLSDGVILLGQGNLIITTSGGFGPYTYSATINGIPNTLTNGLLVNHGDAIESIITTDTNGCTGITSNVYINCPTSTPPPPPELIICDAQVACTTPSTFNFGISATTYDANFEPLNPISPYAYIFNFNLSSSYSGNIVGSYKIYDVDFPNSFLTSDIFANFQTNVLSYESNYIDLQKYYFNANGTPTIELSNYVEFGFTELTPTIPTNLDSPWYITYIPFYELKTQIDNIYWYSPPNGVWVPGSTSVQIDIVLFTEEYCIVSGTTNITIPTTTLTNSTTITF